MSTKIRFVSVLVLVALFMTMAGAQAAAPEVKDIPREKTLVVAWWVDPQFVDDQVYNPFAIGADFQKGLNCIYEGMAYWNVFKNETTMWQAKSFEYNADNTELTIHLRPEVTWSDGKPFTADDVAYTIEQLMKLGSQVRFGSEVQQYTKSVAVVDPQTVKITMPFPFPRYFDRFFTFKWDSTMFPIMPKHIFEGKDWTSFTALDLEQGWPVTTGPLKVVYTAPDRKLFDRRDDWWAVKAGLSTGIAPERVLWLSGLGPDQTKLTQAMINNDIDISQLAVDSIETALKQNPKVITHSGTEKPYGYQDWWAQHLWLNNTKPPFDNPDVRWGVSLLLDRAQIIDMAYNNVTTPIQLPFPSYPSLLKYQDSVKDLLEQYPTNLYDADKAAEHLTKAGYTKNSDGMWADAQGDTIKVTIAGWEEISAAGQVIAEQLKRGGIDAEYTSPPDAWDQFIKRTYIAFIGGLTGSLKEPYDGLNLFTCGKEGGPAANWNSNQAQYCNKDFDAIVAEMAKVNPDDWDKLQPLYRKAIEMYVKDLPAVPLYNWMHHMAMNTTYWSNWPVENQYVNEAPQLLGFMLVIMNIQPAATS